MSALAAGTATATKASAGAVAGGPGLGASPARGPAVTGHTYPSHIPTYTLLYFHTHSHLDTD